MASVRSRPMSQASKRFPEQTYRIPSLPSQQRPKRVEHFALNPWVAFGLAFFMILLGILIQVALHFSIKNDGYPVPPPSPALSWLSTSFLTGFFPTLLIAPIAYMWHVTDWALRWFQPYVSMAKGDAKAEDSVLLDYIAMNKLFGIWHSYRRKHWLVFVTMLIGFTTNLFQPLAGAVLSVKPIPRPQNITVKSATTIGLSPDVNDLNAFFAAAGFSEAAAFQGLPDPPFVHEGWAAAQIEPPKSPGLNASLQWNTTGLQTQANCATANSLNFTLISTDSASIQASMPNGCTGSVTFNPLSADQQYGSSPADPTTCGIDKNTPQQFLPVFFWFYHMRDDVKQPQARGVICQPTIKVFNAQVFLDLSNSNITNVTLIDEYTTANNVTGGDLQGRAFNAVLLDSLAGNNSFIQARATSVRAGIPGAAFRLASQDPRGLDAEFDDETAFFRMINKIYTQHLSVSAKSIYFVPNTGEELSAIKTSLTDRLIVDKLAASILSALCFLIGLAGGIVHFLHLRIRRRAGLYLTTEPGTIATSIALTSHSGFGELLYPYDDMKTLKNKLQGFRFSLDKRTGAIVADEDESDWEPGYKPSNLRNSLMMLNEKRMSDDMRSMRSSMMSSRLSMTSGMSTPRAGSPPQIEISGMDPEEQPLNVSFQRDEERDVDGRSLDLDRPLPSPHV